MTENASTPAAQILVDKDKYMQIYKDQGLSAALTALHHEIKELEYLAFEGPEGYRPQLVEDLKEFRKFSEELWAIRYQPDHQP